MCIVHVCVCVLGWFSQSFKQQHRGLWSVPKMKMKSQFRSVFFQHKHAVSNRFYYDKSLLSFAMVCQPLIWLKRAFASFHLPRRYHNQAPRGRISVYVFLFRRNRNLLTFHQLWVFELWKLMKLWILLWVNLSRNSRLVFKKKVPEQALFWRRCASQSHNQKYGRYLDIFLGWIIGKMVVPLGWYPS